MSTHHPFVSHTIDIFERLYDNLPPLLPVDLVQKMGQALEQVKANAELTADELEFTMIAFGKKVWPYSQAFQEFYRVYESQLREKLLLARATPALRGAYRRFLESGGSWRDLYSGSLARFFEHEQRLLLHQMLVDIKCDIWEFAYGAVLGADRAKYEARVDEFTIIADDIEARLCSLSELAENEQEHPTLAAEIRAQVRSFEHSLVLLGPKLDYHALCAAHGHFVGRKFDLRLSI